MALIIYPPTIDFHWMVQRPQQLMKQFADHGHDVYYCNLTQYSGQKIVNPLANLRIVNKHKYFIREVVPQLKEEQKTLILWCSTPKHHKLVSKYKPHITVFDYIDDFQEWAQELPKMVTKSDIIFTSAEHLYCQIQSEYPQKPAYMIPNAGNIKHFQKFETSSPPLIPAEFQNHNGPIITFIGAWARWVDQDLVGKVAKAFPEALVAVIGVEYGEKVDTSVSNLKYIGYKPYEELPAYLYFSKVCIIPFKKNSITHSTNPVKMYEYLAAGKPIVSTDIPEVKNIPYLYTANDHSSFIHSIEKILSEAFTINKEEINQWLENHSWAKRYEKIMDCLQKHFQL